MGKLVGIRLSDEDIERLDALCNRLGTTRPRLIKNLVSGDAGLVNLIAEKAKELNQLTLNEVIARDKKRREERNNG